MPPQPYDLFNTFNDVLGQDLDWFWTTMFFETWTLDQAVGEVASTSDGVRVRIEIDPARALPDVNRDNNVWEK